MVPWRYTMTAQKDRSIPFLNFPLNSDGFIWMPFFICLLALIFFSTYLHAAVPGLPFTEDFSNTNLKDETKTSATWSPEEQETYLAWQKTVYGSLSSPDPWNIGDDVGDTRSVAVGDMDGDGDLDVVAGNFYNTSKLYLNNGSIYPFFQVTGTQVGNTSYRVYKVALADINKDGNLDIVAACENATNKLFLNNGTLDPFNGVSHTNIGADIDTTHDIAIADLDDDGDLDVAVANRGQTNKFYLNDGTSDSFGYITDGSPIGGDTDLHEALAIGDIDGDGNLDIIVGCWGDTVNYRYYLNNGTSIPFTAADTSISIDKNILSYSTYDVALGDINGDGNLDFVAGGHGRNELFLNNGTVDPFSDSQPGILITNDNNFTQFVMLGDTDADGDLDVVVGNTSGTNKLYLNNGTGDPFSNISTGIPISPDTDDTHGMAFGDLDGDDILDIVTGNWNTTNKLYLNTSSENPYNAVNGIDITADTPQNYEIAIGDVDMDGDIDVVTGSQGRNRLYLNNGTDDPFDGVVSTEIGSESEYTFTVALGDIDGDGDLDFIAGNAGTAPNNINRIYLNSGTSTPFDNTTVGTPIGTDEDWTVAIKVADMDRDGDMDIVTGNGYYPSHADDTNKLYLNDGTLTPFSGITTGIVIGADDTNYTLDIAIGDINADGHLDIVAKRSSDPIKLYLNNGSTLPFSDASSGIDITNENNNTVSIAIGDVDNDGDLDVLAGNYNNDNKLYFNNGTTDPFSELLDGAPIGVETDSTRIIILGDANQDGRLDVITANNNQSNRLYLNNGTTNPFDSDKSGLIIGPADTEPTWGIAFGDIDGDGHPDIITTNYSLTSKYYANAGEPIPFNNVTNADITTDTHPSQSMDMGDVDNDGDMDVVVGNYGSTNRLYLNNGTFFPFDGVTPLDITNDSHPTYSVKLGDIDGDGDLDMVAGNYFATNRLYLNNGTSSPFDGVIGSDITGDAHSTLSIALGDLDNDGNLDVIAGNHNYYNRLYLNNGTTNPFSGITGSNITTDQHPTFSIVLGDVNKDGHLDLASGNFGQVNRLYLNDGTSTPFGTATIINISSDIHQTYSLILDDVNADGNIDLISGNSAQPNRLYLNTDPDNPFAGITGSDITTDAHNTYTSTLIDIDSDGDLDLIAGNRNQPNRLYLNNGTPTPFSDANGIDITSDTGDTRSVMTGDFDNDGKLDLIAANYNQTNRMYRRNLFNTENGLVVSKEIDSESIDNISHATLTSSATLPLHTQIHYYLSNNGGDRFFEVYPSKEFIFPTIGNDLRWKSEMHSKSPVLTPRLSQIHVESRNIAPQATAGGILAYTEDDPPTPIDTTISISDANDVNLTSATVTISVGYQNDQYGQDILGFVNANGISGSWNTGTLTLTGSSSLANYQAALRSVTFESTDTGNPSQAVRTISIVVNDGEFSSTPVFSTVTVSVTNDAPLITDHDPAAPSTNQVEAMQITLNTPPAPSGHIYLTVYDPDDLAQDLSLIIQTGDNYSVQGSSITPIEDFFGQLTVPVVVYDGEDFGNIYNLTIEVNDPTNPWVASVEVLSGGRTVDISFSEPMGASVFMASNYTLSGSGSGTLSSSPDSVGYINFNNYRLFWNSGEMTDGGDIAISVSGVLDAAGNLMGTPLSGTDVGGGIGIAPTTSIDNGEGTYQSNVIATLSCSDTGGSGCSNIYYSLDGTNPSIVYTEPITIDQDMTLRYFSEDAAGNQESVQTEIYSIEILSTISCILSESAITFGGSLRISGTITPNPNESNQGISIEMIPPVGDSVLLSTNADINGDFTVDVDCHSLTSSGAWTIQTSWAGDESHLEATSSPVSLAVSQAESSLSLDVVASESIKVNSRPPIGGDFSPLPLCGSMDLSGTIITLYASEPNGGHIHTLNATTNQYGQFLLNFDTAENGQPFEFDVVGEWTLSAEFTGSTEFASSTTDDVIIRVVPTAGYAILVQGRVQSGEGMPSHHKTASFVYDKLKDRQILDDDIQYLSWLYSDGWDGDPSKNNIQNALTVWARDKMDPDFVHPIAELDTQGQAGDLYIIMIDHGWTDPQDDEEGVFYIYPDDPLTSTELGNWVTELQTNLTGTVSADRNIVVILGFCRAGAFIEDLSDPAHDNRVIVASAAKDESSHRGPQDVDENGQPLRDGEYFVSEFFKSVSYGKSIKQCFEDATLLTESFTSSGSGVTNAPFYDDSIQHPLLNDNGDAIGSNELSSADGEDGAISEFLFIGSSPPEGNDPGDVLITQVNPAQLLGTSDTTADLWAEVDDPNDLRLIWIEVKQPNYNPVDPGAGLQIEMDNFKKASTDVSINQYAWSAVGSGSDPADLFTTPGTYQIFYFAKDNDTGHVSPLIQSRVYKALEGNTIPNSFNLLIPSDNASVLTTTILDWEDTIDPDGDALTYSVLISKDNDQFTDPILIEGLSNSEVLISVEDGIQDLTTYYWKVRAVDEYGAFRETSVRMFDTDNTNPVAGFIKGFVYDATTDVAITSATININNGSLILNSSLNGHYLGSFEPGNFPITVTAGGYQDIQTTLDMPEGITVTMNFGLTPSIVDTYPVATISSPATNVVIDEDTTVNFQGSVANGNAPFTYYWDFDGGATNSTLEDPGSITFNAPGTYTVSFTVTDNDGDIDMDSVNVTVTSSDLCPTDPDKTSPGDCGCGVPDIDTDDDTIPDCNDTDDDGDGILDVDDDFPLDDTETLDTDDDGIGNNADTDDDNDGINDSVETAGPNSGDANNDGTQDSLQNNVACVESYTSQGYVVLETPDGITLSNCQAADNPSPGDAPAEMNFDYGFFDFTINGLTPGGTTTLTMTLPSGVEPDTYYKYGQTQANQTDHWYEFLYDTQTGAEINGNIITLNFVDALRGDDVLTQDSMVIDLGAPGFDTTAVDLEPTANITSPASNTTITTGGSVNFQGSVTSGNSPFTYSWNFGGGATNVNSEDPGNVTFATVGTYTVTFTVTDADNDTDNDSVTITVNAPVDDGGGGGGGGGGGCFIDTLFFSIL